MIKNNNLKTLKFSIRIEAPRWKVWEVLWNADTYAQWAAAFAEGSKAESDWKEGNLVEFTGPNGDGMYARIERNTVNEQMTFQHLGMIKDGKQTPFEGDCANLEGGIEDYQLKDLEDATTLYVFMDAMESDENYFNSAFQKAILIIKELAES